MSSFKDSLSNMTLHEEESGHEEMALDLLSEAAFLCLSDPRDEEDEEDVEEMTEKVFIKMARQAWRAEKKRIEEEPPGEDED